MFQEMNPDQNSKNAISLLRDNEVNNKKITKLRRILQASYIRAKVRLNPKITTSITAIVTILKITLNSAW